MPLLQLLLILAIFVAPIQAQQSPSDAYADAQAEELVRLARERRSLVDRRITRYETNATERISAHMVIAGFERLFFRRETAVRIDWSPDTVRLEVVGAREAQPFMSEEVQLPPADLPGYLTSLAFDPVDPEMLFRIDSTAVWHPLNRGSEAHYRFSSGDTTSIRLPDGREVRLLELRVTARRPAPTLINGSLWVDAETHGMVRAVVRLSRPFSTERGLRSLVPDVTAELDQVSIEYGLWDLRWWLPRTITAQGAATIAGTRFPMAYERVYSDFVVEGDTAASAPDIDSLAADATGRPCRPESFGSISIRSASAPDTLWEEAWEEAAQIVLHGDSTRADADACDRAFLVTAAPASQLLDSPAFVGSIYEPSELVSASERRAIDALVRRIPANPVRLERPQLQLLTPPELLRANRVEGISAGARAIFNAGPIELRAEGRLGTTGEAGYRIGLFRPGPRVQARIGLYREVQAVDLATNPFALSSSVSSVLFGRDENDYFRGEGVELILSPAAGRSQPWDLRLFAERQSALEASSSASIRGLLDSDFAPRANVAAERVGQMGAVLRARRGLGQDPRIGRLRGELVLHGETGDRSFARPLLRVEGERELGRGLGLAFALGAGTTSGDAPVQRQWQIGGSGTVRGHDAASQRGESVWSTRGELTFGPAFLRPSIFADAAWAGDAGDFGRGAPISALGAGVSVMGGLLRVDIARGFGDGGGTRMYLRLGGAL